MMPRGFPQLALRASRHPAAQTLLVHDPPRPDATPTLRRPQRHDPGACGRIPVPLKPEARAEGMRITTHESARIPSARASGFPASGSADSRGARPTSSRRHAHAPPTAAARSRCMRSYPRALEARGASRGNADRHARIGADSLSSRFGLPGKGARRSETAATEKAPARSGRRPRRVLGTRTPSASCLGFLGRPPPAGESPPS
jgi:hypothetical protein